MYLFRIIRRPFLCLVAISACILVIAPAAQATERLVVGFVPNQGLPDQVAQLHEAGLTSVTRSQVTANDIPQLDVAVVHVATARAATIARRNLLASGKVQYVEIDHIASITGAPTVPRATSRAGAGRNGAAGPDARAAWVPNDPRYASQWALAKMHASRAWDFTRGASVVIAVVDTGVDYIHPDLAGRVTLGKDFVDSDNDPMDVQGHGTHVAGIAAAGADDGVGVAGLAPSAQILAVRVLDAEGSGYYSWIASGIVYAADNGAQVINLSLGGSQGATVLQEAVDYATSRGAVVTCASGNDGAKAIGFPARYSGCTSIGASTSADGLASFSDRGPGLDLVAPGKSILSSVMGGGYEAWDGTSMATPYASGLAALLFAQGLTRQQVLTTMQDTARDLGPRGYDTSWGHGRIDAGAAVVAASVMPRRAADVTKPTVTGLVVGAPQRVVHRSSKLVWKRASISKTRVVGRTAFRGHYAWNKIRRVGRTRVITRMSMRRGRVYQRIEKQRLVTKRTTRTTFITPVTVTATDDIGVDRVALDVNGHTRGVDWNRSNGWKFQLPCVAGSAVFTAWAYDEANNEMGGRITATVRC